MTPVKKRPRLEKDEDKESPNVSSNPKEEFRLHEEAIAQFLNDLDGIATDKSSAVAKASCTLLGLRSLQRQLLHTMEQSQDRVMQKRLEVERQELALQNLQYERKYLERQCRECKDYHTPQLEQMCRDETDEDNNSDTSPNSVMNLFLCGSADISHNDPAQQQVIMGKLHKELNLRGSLERDLTQAQTDLAEKKVAFHQRQQFLEDLPKKLKEMETASLPLQKFFHKSNLPSSEVNLIGTERKALFDLARALPGPLYTLFVQIQSYLDAFSEKDLKLEIALEGGKPAAFRHTEESEEWYRAHGSSILLHLPVPDIKETATVATRTPKELTVQFDYYPKLHLVTARAYGCEERVDVSTLLLDLFPGDGGNILLNGANLMAEKPPTPDQLLENLSGRPYHWCNYIAGLQFPEKSKDPLEINTKAVLNALEKRVRASTTLQHLLNTLEKRKPNPIPVHPSMAAAAASNPSCDAKLVGWTLKAQGDSEHCKSYLAIIRRKANTLRATVTLDTARYPAVPPVWSLTGAEESWGEKQGSATALADGSNPLYDAALGELESKVNGSLENLALEGEEETYEWILVHQLRKLVEDWDSMQRTQEASESR